MTAPRSEALVIETPTLPLRAGGRPKTTDRIPHEQLDQQPTDDRFTLAVMDEAATWPHVTTQTSGISVEGACALSVDTDLHVLHSYAFMIGREFAHAHAKGDFSFHAVLPHPLAREAERAGWAEPHFMVKSGLVPPTVVMLYAPRDEQERDVVLSLVRASYDYAIWRPSPTP